MKTPVELAHDFVSFNLDEIAKEQLELENTGILIQGKYREAQRMLMKNMSIDDGNAMSVVRSILLTELIKHKLEI